MSEVVKIEGGGEVAKFDPKKAKANIAKANAVIEFAQDIRDWPLLERAVDEKIEEIDQFVKWWKRHVTIRQSQGDNQHRSVATPPPTSIPADDATKQTGISKDQVKRWSNRLKEPEKFRVMLYYPAHRKAFGEASQPNQQSLSPEHYTPAEYIEAARMVLGGFDLDPASCDEANEIVKADKFFTAEDDGLKQQWDGRVWLNPPYGRMAGAFIEKLAGEVNAGRVTDAITLVNAHCTDTTWFQRLWDGLLCFTDHRINFYGDDKRKGSTHGSVFVYFGQRGDLFIERFSQFGPIVGRIEG